VKKWTILLYISGIDGIITPFMEARLYVVVKLEVLMFPLLRLFFYPLLLRLAVLL
jgi:hypothetical protein